MQKLNDLEAAAIDQQGEEEKGQEVPPHWNTSFFTVDYVDQIAAKAKETGATVIFGPMAVFNAGRMAMIQDPQEAMFAVWQPKAHIGVRIKGETGALMWNELMTTESVDATQFYSGLLGMDSSKMPGPIDYTMLNVGGTNVVGVMAITEEMGPVPPHRMVYFGVDDVDAAAQNAESLGGSIVVPPADIPEIGRFAGLKDPPTCDVLHF